MAKHEYFKTLNYDKFKRLEGNRKVLEPRVRKIMNSIQKVGYIPNPIIVNDLFEVIDGQGRLEALKRLKMPVHYIIVPQIGLDECISMNINQSNWSVRDYIETYAETGNVSYMYLLNLIKTYGNTFQQKVILNAVTGRMDTQSSIIKSGNFQCDADDYNRAMAILKYLKNFTPIIKRLKGHIEFYYMALAFSYLDEEIDNDRMLDKIEQRQANLIPVTTIQQALGQLEEIYNNRARSKVYLVTHYKECMDEKYGWYLKRYGNKYKEEY